MIPCVCELGDEGNGRACTAPYQHNGSIDRVLGCLVDDLSELFNLQHLTLEEGSCRIELVRLSHRDGPHITSQCRSRFLTVLEMLSWAIQARGSLRCVAAIDRERLACYERSPF